MYEDVSAVTKVGEEIFWTENRVFNLLLHRTGMEN